MSQLKVLVLLPLILTNGVRSENILFFFGISSISHRVGAWPLATTLGAKGHTVTFLSPFPAPQPSKDVVDYIPESLKNWVESWNETAILQAMRENGEIVWDWYMMGINYGSSMCDVLMNDPVYIEWLKSKRFDLVVVDSLVNECAYGMAWYHKAKVIVYNTAIPFSWHVDPMGFPDESSWVPDLIWHFTPGNLNILQRAVALFNPLIFNYLREYHYFPKLEATIRSTLAPDLPSLSSLERNVSLMFVNHHFAEDYPRPFPPNVIPVPSLQCDLNPEPLPKELAKFVDSSSNPVIYMSFGSYAELSNFSPQIQSVFFTVLKNLKTKGVNVIWKTKMERPKDLPDNVFTSSWMPQQSILSHPKIKAFISHGGLLGIQEAICHSVPIVAFPIFAEQDYNADKLEAKGVGIQLEITTITIKQLEGAIDKILKEQSYAKNMAALSKRFLDRPVSSLQTAVWWTEYVLRHEDLGHLKPGSVHLSWWKKRNLDIWFCVFVLFLLILKLLVVCVKVAFRVCCGASKKKNGKKLKSS